MLPKVSWGLSTYSWNFSRWLGRIPKISRLGDASWKNSVTLWNSKADKSTSRLKYVQRQQVFYLTMQWIKEVETAKSMGDLLIWRSIVGRSDFHDYDMLDAMIDSALKKLLDKQVHFRRRVSKSTALKNTTDSFENGTFLSWSSSIFVLLAFLMQHKAYQNCSNYSYSVTMSKISMHDWTRHYCQPLRHFQKWSWKDCTSQNWRNSVQLQTVLALYDQENIRNIGQPNYSSSKTAVGLHIDQSMRARNCRARNEIGERGMAERKEPYVARKVGECIQWKVTGQCSERNSCTFSHDPALGDRCEAQRQKGSIPPLQHLIQ